jgi:membrane protein implicated in regulation of membrane protease activity
MTTKSFFSTLLAVIGWVGALLSGGCTLLFLGSSGSSGSYQGAIWLFGGVPFLVSLLFIWLGRKISKKSTTAEESDQQDLL